MQRELIEIGTMVRVENGPARKTAVANEALLDDRMTATHYQVGRPDAMGKIIELGKEITYLDYRGEWVWYIYQRDEQQQRWLPAGVEKTKAAALAVANGLAGEED
jgi:hypothetical protein